jgi:hypothetical protein
MGFGKYNTFYVFVVFFLISFSQHSFSQEKPDGLDVMLSPRITIGYTFGAGINCGLDLGVGVYRIKDIMTGVNFSYYFVFVDQSNHQIKGITLTAETKYISGKVGIGAVSKKWGLRNVNKASTPGIMVDFSASADAYKAPWIGFKAFIFDRSKWMFHELPSYTSAYGYFKTQEIEIYKQEDESSDGQ